MQKPAELYASAGLKERVDMSLWMKIFPFLR